MPHSIKEQPSVLTLVTTRGRVDVSLAPILEADHLRFPLSDEKKKEIDTIAATIASGGISVVSFGPVEGYVCDGNNRDAQERINTYKGITSDEAKAHPFALVTTPEIFPTLIDVSSTSPDFARRIKEGRLAQAIHYRVRATNDVPEGCYSLEGTKKIVQLAIFGNDASPELEYLLTTLSDRYQINYVIATSANVHGETEVDIYRKGQELAKHHDLPFLNAGPVLDEIPGSFAGVHVTESAMLLFRNGHYTPELLLYALAVESLPTTQSVAAPRYPYPEIPKEVVSDIFQLPVRLRLQALRLVVDQLEKRR